MSRIERFSLVIFYKAKKKKTNHTRVFLDFYKITVVFYEFPLRVLNEYNDYSQSLNATW